MKLFFSINIIICFFNSDFAVGKKSGKNPVATSSDCKSAFILPADILSSNKTFWASIKPVKVKVGNKELPITYSHDSEIPIEDLYKLALKDKDFRKLVLKVLKNVSKNKPIGDQGEWAEIESTFFNEAQINNPKKRLALFGQMPTKFAKLVGAMLNFTLESHPISPELSHLISLKRATFGAKRRTLFIILFHFFQVFLT